MGVKYMGNDNRRLMNDMVVNLRTVFPDLDEIELTIKVEEVLSNYKSKVKTAAHLENDLKENIELYISARTIEGLGKSTLEGYQRDLLIMDRFINKPTVTITTTDIRKYLSSLEDDSPGTLGKKLSTIKTFFTWLVDEEIILRNPAAKIRKIKQSKRLPKALNATELEMVREACETYRETAIVEVMYSTGCRVSEISGMKRTDVNWSKGSIKVIGKGDKERVVYLNPKATYHLKEYLEFTTQVEENNCEYLFSTIRRPYRQMKSRTIQNEIDRIVERTTIKKRVTPHVFRHTMATLAMENGIELGDLQQLLGHSNPSTTLRYAEVSEERKLQAHKRFVR